jgi:Ca2+-binding EF-hand superfamily protein
MTLPKLALSALLLAMAGTLAPAGSVQAQDVSAETRLKTWDPDNDGTIDMAEVKKAASAQFDRLDGDRDGTLDMNEMAATKVDENTFTKADPDKDGTLTKDEYFSIVETRFKSADPDNDGTVSLAELKAQPGQALGLLLK